MSTNAVEECVDSVEEMDSHIIKINNNEGQGDNKEAGTE